MGEINSVRGKFPGIQTDASLASQASEDIKKQKETLNKGLGLEDIPEMPNMFQTENDSSEEIDESEAEDLLEQIEGTIKEIQDRLKNSTAKKIKYAANPNYGGARRQLLKSAFNDVKELYLQLEKIKEMLF